MLSQLVKPFQPVSLNLALPRPCPTYNSLVPLITTSPQTVPYPTLFLPTLTSCKTVLSFTSVIPSSQQLLTLYISNQNQLLTNPLHKYQFLSLHRLIYLLYFHSHSYENYHLYHHLINLYSHIRSSLIHLHRRLIN